MKLVMYCTILMCDLPIFFVHLLEHFRDGMSVLSLSLIFFSYLGYGKNLINVTHSKDQIF